MSRFLKIGAFFLATGMAGTGYIVMSSDGFNDWSTYTLEVILEDAAGLTTNSRVFMAGVPVGIIRSIALEGGQARVVLAIKDEITVYEDAQLFKQPSSLLGTSILALHQGEPGQRPLAEGDRLTPARSRGDFTSTLQGATELTEVLQEILETFRDQHLELVALSLENIRVLTARVESRSEAELDRISRILESTALMAERLEGLSRDRVEDVGVSLGEVRGILEDIRYLTGNLRSGEGNLGRALNEEELYERILGIASSTQERIDQLGEILGTVNTAAGRVDTIIARADPAIEEAQDYLQTLTGLQVDVDVRGQYQFLNPQGLSGLGLRITPRTNDRYYQVGVSTAPGGVATTTVTSTTDNNGAVSTERETVTQRGYLMSLQLARRFGPLTLRGGLIDSRMGLGIDLQPLDWLELSAEAFRFGQNETPHLRASASFYPLYDPESDNLLHWLYLQGGIVDSLTDARDFYLGGGIRFRDREIRGVVGMLPLAAP